jgi:hypothetical protein
MTIRIGPAGSDGLGYVDEAGCEKVVYLSFFRMPLTRLRRSS